MLKLNPHETREIDMRKLRDGQEKDFKGNKIPASASDGSVNWIRLDNVAVSGRMVVLKRHGAMASGYNCQHGLLPGDAPPEVMAKGFMRVCGGLWKRRGKQAT
jgi:hypothetical protein